MSLESKFANVAMFLFCKFCRASALLFIYNRFGHQAVVLVALFVASASLELYCVSSFSASILWRSQRIMPPPNIDASRDFLDLRAESACSSALAAFGSQTSAPRPTDQIPVDAFAALAREEAAGLDLAELELRQAVRRAERSD